MEKMLLFFVFFLCSFIRLFVRLTCSEIIHIYECSCFSLSLGNFTFEFRVCVCECVYPCEHDSWHNQISNTLCLCYILGLADSKRCSNWIEETSKENTTQRYRSVYFIRVNKWTYIPTPIRRTHWCTLNSFLRISFMNEEQCCNALYICMYCI